MWDKKELLRKLKYLKELSKNINDEEKRYEVAQNQSSILEMLELLDNKRITIYNSPLLLSTTKYALKKACKKTSNYQIIWSKDLKKDIEFSFYLCKNLALQPLLAEDESQKVYSEKECMAEVIDFANDLDDEELSNAIITTVKDSKHINLGKKITNRQYSAITINLSIFNERFIYSPKNPNTLLHEIIHALDLKTKGSVMNDYLYSYEVPSYAIEIYKNVLNNRFSNEFNVYINMAKNIMGTISGRPFSVIPKRIIENMTFNEKNITNFNSHKIVLLIKNYLIGSIFAKKILDNKEEGLKEYKEMLHTRFDENKTPDYSRWGITDDVIMDYSKNLIKYFSEYQKGGKSL